MYAVLRVAKVKTMGEIGALGKHNERLRETPNADADRRGENVRLVGSGDWIADAQARLDDAPKIRSNAVLAIEHVMTASRDFYQQGDDQERAARLADWTERSMAWLRDRYGAENVVAAVLHKDEQTPHIQALVVPLHDERGLNAKHWLGGREKLSAMQDGYARAMEPFGLARGVHGSVADHQTVKEFYAKIEAPTPAPEIVRAGVEVDKPGRIVGNPERWAAEQTARIVAELVPTLDDALTKAAHYEDQAATAEANIVVLQERVRVLEQERATLQRDYTTLAAQVRGLDLREVIDRMGGERDRYDRHKWHLNGEHISITGEKFYNHDRSEGGGGAIDLVKHANYQDFKGAVLYLSGMVGAEAAVRAAAHHGARQAQEQAAQMIARERADRPERAAVFVGPGADEERWAQVQAYLVEQRGIPRGMVDALHERGDIYADARGNAVFARRDEEGAIVGAARRGTLPGSAFQGLALGTRRDEGHFTFSYTIGKPSPHDAPQYHITESAIDALSRAALVLQEGETGRYVFMSNDGHGELPRRQIDEALADRGMVWCGFDNDAGGNKLWAQVKEAYPRAEAIERERPPAGAKDWNDALRAAQAQAQERAQGQEEARASTRSRAPAKDKDYHDR